MNGHECDTRPECGHPCPHTEQHVPAANCNQRNYCRFAECVVICKPIDEVD